MIIPRKYEWLGVLYENDKEARKAIDDAFDKYPSGNFSKEKLLSYNHCNIPAFLNLGCSIPGNCHGYYMKQFEKLDKTNPYDNGLTFNDVTNVEFESSRKGTAIQMRFVRQISDLPYRIFGFAAIDNKNGSMNINEGWEMTAPFVIG